MNNTKEFKVLKDGEVKGVFNTENEAFEWVQKNTCYSWDWANKHEGWKIEEGLMYE
jgi:hypothetical protein